MNVFPQFSLESWRRYWQMAGGGDVIFANDTNREAIMALKVQTPGATVVINKEGRIIFRDRFATTYDILKIAVESAL